MTTKHLFVITQKGYQARVDGKPCVGPYAGNQGFNRTRNAAWRDGWNCADRELNKSGLPQTVQIIRIRQHETGQWQYRLESPVNTPLCDWQFGPWDKMDAILQSKDRFWRDCRIEESLQIKHS